LFFVSICQILWGHLSCLRAFEAECISLGNKSHQKLKINKLEELITSWRTLKPFFFLPGEGLCFLTERKCLGTSKGSRELLAAICPGSRLFVLSPSGNSLFCVLGASFILNLLNCFQAIDEVGENNPRFLPSDPKLWKTQSLSFSLI